MQHLQHTSTLALRQRRDHLLRSFQLPPALLHASLIERFLNVASPSAAATLTAQARPFFYLNRCFAKGQISRFCSSPPTRSTRHVRAWLLMRRSRRCSTTSAKSTANCSAVVSRSARRPDERTRSVLDYVAKVFRLGQLARQVRSDSPTPDSHPALVPDPAHGRRAPGQQLPGPLQANKRRRWQHLIHWRQRISDDALHYVSERFHLGTCARAWSG